LNSDLSGLYQIDRRMALPVIGMLARAFSRYPLLTHFYPNAGQRALVTINMLALPVFTCLRYGRVYATSERLEGAAVWTPSQDYPAGFWRLLRSVPWRYVWGNAGPTAGRLLYVDHFINEIHQRLAPFPHYYLEILGVDPSYQKQGFSSRLIKPMLTSLDQKKIGCYLETQDPQDVPVYQHFGFKIIDHSAIPDTPLYSWALWRESRS
jgi:GNAT superfamily N-acetyltransferase